MGKWIYGEGAFHKMLPEYKALKEAHIAFHKKVGDIIRSISSGAQVSEDMIFGTKSEIGKFSLQVVSAIQALERKLKKM